MELTSPSFKGRHIDRRATFVSESVVEGRWTIEDAFGTMSPQAFVVNMFADLCPPGFLPLAYGLRYTGYVPGIGLLLVFLGLCVYTMWTVGRSSEIIGEKTFAAQWAKAIGPRTSWVPVACVALVCFGCTVAYACFYADILVGVLPALGLPVSRTVCLWGFALFPTLPLCRLKDLSALAPSSFAALIAVLYTAAVMTLRAVDGTYAPGGRFYSAPDLPEDSHMFDFGAPSLDLVNGLALGYLSHYNGCKYYRELQGHTPSRFRRCTLTAMALAASLFAVTMLAGFATFGRSCGGVVLTSYAENDALVNAARLGVGLSIIASYPLMFSGLREAVVDLLKQGCPTRSASFDTHFFQDAFTCLAVAAITAVATVLTDPGVVVGIVGAVCGSSIIYIIPCSIYACALRKFLDPKVHSKEIKFQAVLALLGVVLAISGLIVTLA
jgi:amino acid permease